MSSIKLYVYQIIYLLFHQCIYYAILVYIIIQYIIIMLTTI